MGQAKSDLLQRESYALEDGGNERPPQLSIRVKKNNRGRVELDLSMSELRKVYKKSLKNRKVQVIKLNGNYLTTLPYHVTYFDQLNELYLSNNNFEYVPAPVFELKALEILDLSYNKITSLPDALADVETLTKLDVSYNKIDNVAGDCERFKNLEELNLEGNCFNKLPVALCSIEQLKILKLCKNKIKYLPKHIGKLTNLEELYISDNGLSKINSTLTPFLQRLTRFKIKSEAEKNTSSPAKVVKTTLSRKMKTRIYDDTESENSNEENKYVFKSHVCKE